MLTTGLLQLFLVIFFHLEPTTPYPPPISVQVIVGVVVVGVFIISVVVVIIIIRVCFCSRRECVCCCRERRRGPPEVPERNPPAPPPRKPWTGGWEGDTSPEYPNLSEGAMKIEYEVYETRIHFLGRSHQRSLD